MLFRYSKGMFFISTPEAHKHVLKDAFHKYEKTETFESAMAELFGKSLFTSDGEVWRYHRTNMVKLYVG